VSKGGAFTQHVVETMCWLNERPIMSALSNPTDKAECSAEQAYSWSKGKALYPAGVQFPDVTLNGQTSPWPGQQLLHLSGHWLGQRRRLLTRSVPTCARRACCCRAKPIYLETQITPSIVD
jgi:Malic enzyme, NAD binding domain